MNGLGILRLGESFETLVLGGVEVPSEFSSHCKKLILNHAVHIIVVDTLDHEPKKDQHLVYMDPETQRHKDVLFLGWFWWG